MEYENVREKHTQKKTIKLAIEYAADDIEKLRQDVCFLRISFQLKTLAHILNAKWAHIVLALNCC